MISMCDISIGYGKSTLIKGLSYDVNSLGITSIIGPSGVGKTSLLQVMSAIKMPLSGRILVEGRDTRSLGYIGKHRLWKKTMSFHFQINNVMPHESILYNICFKRIVCEEEKQQLSSLCQQVGLEMSMNIKARQLSVGQKNRLSIIRSLYADKEITLLDEPLASLDRKSRERVLSLIQEYSHKRSIVVASHELIGSENLSGVLNLNDYAA